MARNNTNTDKKTPNRTNKHNINKNKTNRKQEKTNDKKTGATKAIQRNQYCADGSLLRRFRTNNRTTADQDE